MKTKINVLIVHHCSKIKDGLCKLIEANDEFCLIGQGSCFCYTSNDMDTSKIDVAIGVFCPREGDSYAIYRKMHEQKIKMILYTSADSAKYVEPFLLNGGSGWISEDSAPEQIVEAIKTVANGKMWVSCLP